MTTSPILPSDTLSKEIQAIDGLTQLLTTEQSCLLDADVKKLETLTAQKTSLVAQMSQLASMRHKALTTAGLPPEDAAMPSWFANNNDHQNELLWHKLLNKVRAAKELNRVNGLLISTHMVRNQAALQILRGHAQSESTYGSDGRTDLRTTGRSIVAR